MNAFLKILSSRPAGGGREGITRQELRTLQVNMGNLCNQSCAHCHVGASPAGDRIMPTQVLDAVAGFLSRTTDLALDITGGAPELNPSFRYLVRAARRHVKEIIVRSNLTVFFEPGKETIPSFLREHGVHIIGSLPCYTRENVDAQRGDGVFERSVRALKRLNSLGFGIDERLPLDLVYNPAGAFLPPRPAELEEEYRRALKRDHGVVFNRLITITNVPLRRFKAYLDERNGYESYLKLLTDSFNPDVVKDLMCRTLLSVGHDGRLYDCDFNQALGLEMTGGHGTALTIQRLDIARLKGRMIETGEHCLACAAGVGSSCRGALAGWASGENNK